eukprot:8074109-Karenia_brevis.AAC.1
MIWGRLLRGASTWSYACATRLPTSHKSNTHFGIKCGIEYCSVGTSSSCIAMLGKTFPQRSKSKEMQNT